jgi:hypothetical protein
LEGKPNADQIVSNSTQRNRLMGVLEKVFTIIKEDIQRNLQISHEDLK